MDYKRLKIKKIIDDYKLILKKLGITVERTILFGSFAKGNPRKDSDIDLIIVSEDFKKMNLRQRLEVLGIAAARIMQPIEAKGYTLKEIASHSKPKFLSHILKIGMGV